MSTSLLSRGLWKSATREVPAQPPPAVPEKLTAIYPLAASGLAASAGRSERTAGLTTASRLTSGWLLAACINCTCASPLTSWLTGTAMLLRDVAFLCCCCRRRRRRFSGLPPNASLALASPPPPPPPPPLSPSP
jgi:hypothetical protein